MDEDKKKAWVYLTSGAFSGCITMEHVSAVEILQADWRPQLSTRR